MPAPHPYSATVLGIPLRGLASDAERELVLSLSETSTTAGIWPVFQAAGATDDHLRQPWHLIYQEKKLFEAPRAAALRGMAMNHIVHHRGQLSVYLRLNDIAVPSIYGPSADEM